VLDRDETSGAASERNLEGTAGTGGHADHSASTPCWRRAQTHAIRTKPGSFKGGNKSPHHIFAAALATVSTAPELHRGVPKVLSVHSIDNLHSTPPFTY